MPVQAGQTVEFTYALGDGATYGAGSPRVFFEIQGAGFFNTFDGNPSDAGTNNGNGTFTKSVPITANGRIGQLGVVWDDGKTGSIVVGNVKVGAYTVKFR